MKDNEKQYISMKEMLTKTSFEPITNCNCRQNKEGAFVDLLNQEIEAMKYFASKNAVSMFDIVKNCEHKEKQIEDMAKSCKNCVHNVVCDKKLDLKYFFDNHDCEHYQPKLPEDSVVLSKEEYRCLKSIEKSYDPFWFCSYGGCEGVCKECKDTCEMSIFVKERKETAEKFARNIFNHITTPEVWEKLRQQWLNKEGNFIANKHIYDLLIEPVAKQFAVKIKE